MFQYPALLWGLLALAVPIVVHLFRLQRARTLDFSHLQFLRQVQQARLSRQQLRRWLLLGLRLLAVAAVVGAAARWLWDGGAAPAAERLLVVVDDSPSLELPRQGQRAWEGARALARQVVAAAPRTAQVAVLSTGALDGGADYTPRDRALQRLDALVPTQQTVGMGAVLRALPTLAGGAPTRAVFITDGQQILASDTAAPRAPAGLDLSLALLDPSTSNRWLARVELLTDAPAAGQPVLLRAHLRSAGPQPPGRTTISAEIDGRPVAQAAVEWKNDTASALLRFTPRVGGWLAGSLRLDDPAAPHDNALAFVLRLTARPRVLWALGPTPAEGLDIIRKELLTSAEHTVITAADLPRQRLVPYQAVVLTDPEQLAGGGAEQLAAFVEAGGGLLIWPGPRSTADALAPLVARLGLGTLAGPERYAPAREVRRAALEHPLLREAFIRPDAAREAYDGPLVTQGWRLTANAQRELSAIVTHGDGAPVLAEWAVGEGRVALFTTYPAADWSDWATRTSYAPLVVGLVERLARGGAWPLVIDPTTAPRLELPAAGPDLLQLTADVATDANANADLSSTRLTPTQRITAGRVRLSLEGLPLHPTTYRAEQGDSLLARLAIRWPEAESDPAALSAEQWLAWLSARGWPAARVLTGTPASVAAAVADAPQGADASTLLLIVALLALIAELLVARYVR